MILLNTYLLWWNKNRHLFVKYNCDEANINDLFGIGLYNPFTLKMLFFHNINIYCITQFHGFGLFLNILCVDYDGNSWGTMGYTGILSGSTDWLGYFGSLTFFYQCQNVSKIIISSQKMSFCLAIFEDSQCYVMDTYLIILE